MRDSFDGHNEYIENNIIYITLPNEYNRNDINLENIKINCIVYDS